MSAQIVIAATGAVSAVGASFPAISAAVRGKLNAFRNYDDFPSVRRGVPLALARLMVDGFTDRTAFGRMIVLGLWAAEDCLSRLPKPKEEGTPVPVILALPPDRPGWGAEDAQRLAAELLGRFPCPIDPDRSTMMATGHHGGLAAVEAGADMIRKGEAEAVIVGGIDSFDIAYLDWMDHHQRLKAEDVPNGIIPGEGAAFVLLASDAYCAARGVKADVAIVASGQAVEPQPWYDGKPLLGQGLSELLQGLLGADDRRADITYCDHTGEVWRSEEWSTAYLRTGSKHGHPLDLRHPASCWGDIGAASGPMLLAIAQDDLRRAPPDAARTALVFCASDLAPYRSGTLIARRGAVPA